MAQKFKLLFFLSLVVAYLGDAVIPDDAVAAATVQPANDPTTTNTSVTTNSSVSATTSVTTNSSVSATTSVTTNSSVTTNTSGSVEPTNSSITDAETSTPSLTTPKPDSCDPNPCGPGSTCEARVYPNYICLCQPGDIYNNISKSCQAAKVFPGDLVVPGILYTKEMEDLKSKEFLYAAKAITTELNIVFQDNPAYSGSTVLKLEPNATTRVWSREGELAIKATVEISFTENADITTADVLKEIESGSGVLDGGSFTVKEENLCRSDPCDTVTSQCSFKDGSIVCTCLESYVPTAFSERMCVACPSGQRVDGEKCVKCSFGRSGLNCSESWKLILVIVASVLGALLLITLILLPIVSRKSSKKKSTKKNKNADIREPYVSPIPAKASLANDSFAKSQAASANRSDNAFANAGMPQIPRATTTNGWDRGNLEMTPSNSRQNLVPGGRNARLYEDDDDMAPHSQSRPQSNLYAQPRPQSNVYAQARPQSNVYAQARPQSNVYAPARPQTNPYGQNQPQANPYAPNQGHTNPYYMQDDGRRFN